MILVCRQCGEEWNSVRSVTKFCSRECFYASRVGVKQSAETIEKRANAVRGRKHSEEARQKMSQRRLSNPFVRGEHHYNWNPDREEAKRRTKLARICYGLVGRAIARGHEKQHRTLEELGYDFEQLKSRLESQFKPGMTWENHGKGPGKWHVDHIKPITAFPLGTSPKEINALDNLQPLWESENLSKGGVRNHAKNISRT